MPQVIATVGLPRSGKSTWCNKWASAEGWPIVCPDDIRMALHGQEYIASAEPMVWATTWLMLRALLQRHSVVLFDATNITRKRRQHLESEALIAVVYHVIETDVETCIKRAITKDDPDTWAVIIQGMADDYEGLEAGETEWAAGE